MTTLLLFGSQTCVPCKAVKSQLDLNNIQYDYVDVFEQPEVAGQYGVMSTPTMFELDENGEQLSRTVGGKIMEVIMKHKE